ncbi:MAG: hypothetical protein KJS97_13960 [Alphaproteobacteria bacterium]|nr:hypothetical protein [Alphaproteobacteria bacterium]
MSAIDDRPFPRGALIAAGVMIAASLAMVAGVRLGVLPYQDTFARAHAEAAVAVERDLIFEDGAAGAIVVRDAATRAVVATLPAGEDGFVRGVMRGLAYHRTLNATPHDAPFALRRLTDGGLVLVDPQTERHIDLGAFGVTNKAAFARFLAKEPVARS